MTDPPLINKEIPPSSTLDSRSVSDNSDTSITVGTANGGLFAGLQLTNAPLVADDTPRQSNSSSVKIVDYANVEDCPTAPSLVPIQPKDSNVPRPDRTDSNQNGTENVESSASDVTSFSELNRESEKVKSAATEAEKIDTIVTENVVRIGVQIGQAQNVMSTEDVQILNEAFQSPTKPIEHQHIPARRGLGKVVSETPVPHPEECLNIMRKFAYKTQKKIPVEHGGTKSKSVWNYVIPVNPSVIRDDETFFGPYGELIDVIFDENSKPMNDVNNDDPAVFNSHNATTKSHILEKTAMEHSSRETQERASKAIALFIHLFSIWGHASSSFLERKDKKSMQTFTELQVAIFSAASSLVSYGCLDNVLIELINEDTRKTEQLRGAQMLAQSVFNSDLSIEGNELAAIKFLLEAGCRTVTSGSDDSLLRGGYLLQSIRTLYHVYLTTDSEANKITARAALQQLVTSVFAKTVRTPVPTATAESEKEFPSENHRDCFLVLRSICKLSMRNLPDYSKSGDDGHVMYSHVGIQTSASNEAWDSERSRALSEIKNTTGMDGSERGSKAQNHQVAQLLYTSALHPALESKLLALELILYVLQNVNFSMNGFIQECGSQFHSAIRNYLCVSLLKNCTADNTKVVSLSLQIFVPTVRHFRTVLKAEIEAFVTNVFFVILESKNSPAEHKRLVVNTFHEICSDPNTLAEIFLNYDCDLSAVDLFHRIVNTLSKLARTGYHLHEEAGKSNSAGTLGSLLLSSVGPTEALMEKQRNDGRALRLNSMRALRQILASLHASIVEPLLHEPGHQSIHHANEGDSARTGSTKDEDATDQSSQSLSSSDKEQTLVEIYGSKKKRRAEELEAILRFNQKPSAGIAYSAKCGHFDDKDPVEVARYLLKNKDSLDKTQIGEYLGREPEYQKGFMIAVLHEYVRLLDFSGLVFDDAIRFFLSGFRLPGEAQKIDRIMEKFAERFTEQNPDVFPTADVAFILSFSIIMLNTDLHNPAIKEERRMTKDGFIRNNRGICDGKDLPEELLSGIFDRIRSSPISLKEDDEAREKRSGDTKKSLIGLPAALSPASFFTSHFADLDRARENNFQKERDHIVRTTESLLKRRRHSQASLNQGNTTQIKNRPPKTRTTSRFVLSGDSGLRDEYVSPMFDVTWGPALAAFSTAIESANGTTMGALLSIASDEELEQAAENAAETIEVCLTGFRFAICTAGLCGNSIARDAYMLALSRFSQLGTGVLLEPRHVRCVQTMLSLAREDGELLGGSWEHVFKALSEINRYHQLFQLMARNDRAAARAAERRRAILEARQKRKKERAEREVAHDNESLGEPSDDGSSDNSDLDDDSLGEYGVDSYDDYLISYDDEDMDAKAIDEANAREIYNAVSEGTIEAIYERSSSLSAVAVKEFVLQLCQVSRLEIAVGNNIAPDSDLNQVAYRQKHTLLDSKLASGEQFHHTQPNIYNLQKLVEVTHYNMDTRPRLLFADIWVTVADHLTNVALHSNVAIAMYAVDSFRQLSIQYLKREELEAFEFQKRFLKPLVTVMARSDQNSTKELLLNCVGRIIHVFNNEDSIAEKRTDKGGLRSGWVPILNILGLGGQDNDETIAQMSFKILSNEIKLCLHNSDHPDVLLTEHFVDTVRALIMFANGPHDELCPLAIDLIVALVEFLDSIKTASIHGTKKQNDTSENIKKRSGTQTETENLEFWWPVLLGLSQAIGDDRSDVRTKALDALVGIIHKHFFSDDSEALKEHTCIQTLQLIFRGVLTPILEFAETSVGSNTSIPSLPEDFEFVFNTTEDKKRSPSNDNSESTPPNWLETTFDSFMDACVAICNRSISQFGSSTLVEEIFAILNSCLLSDSGALAVRGLRRLEQFVTSDLETSLITDDVWATVSHMLRRCLSVKGLPSRPTPRDMDEGSEVFKRQEAEYANQIREFVEEERMLVDRRYVGSNAVMVVGILLSSERFSVGLRWRLFLTAGLGRGIIEWERVASILTPPNSYFESLPNRPPDYRETALYGRKWMNRLLLQLASMKDIVEAPSDADPKTNRFATGQKLVMDLTQGMLISFVEKERLASKYRNSFVDKMIYVRLTALVNELLTGFGNMDSAHLQKMSWISPILLSSCIQSKNEEIRLMVQKLVGRTSATKDPPGKKFIGNAAPVTADDTIPLQTSQTATTRATESNENDKIES